MCVMEEQQMAASEPDRGQVTGSAAEIYDEFFVPALFDPWTDRVLDVAQVGDGQLVLDVACGTGVLARAALARVGPTGMVVGLDLNPGMLAVAARRAPAIEWRAGRAEALPFASGHFDRVVSQFGLMFFEDRVRALREMRRVLRPGGKLAVAVWDSLEKTPGYYALVILLQELFGDEVADKLRSPFCLGDVAELAELFAAAEMPHAEIITLVGTARFPSLQQWVYIDIKGWTLAEAVDDTQFAQLLAAAEERVGKFVQRDGTVAFAAPAHLISAKV